MTERRTWVPAVNGPSCTHLLHLTRGRTMCGRPHLGTMAADGEQKMCGQCMNIAEQSEYVIGIVYVEWQVVL